MSDKTHDSCGCRGNTCGCCAGTTRLTPGSIANRPGLSALTYRVGTHAVFFETMKARLSSMALDIQRAELDEEGHLPFDRKYPLTGLTTRSPDDPAIALLDAWAAVADVLTFYQERIANEGYLPTATERRSILELAKLVGYKLRPGLASTVYLAYTIDDNQKEPVEIPVGARVQSVPGPGEQAQTFETTEKLEARAAWNQLRPRLRRPQTAQSIRAPVENNHSQVFLKGTTTNLKPNDPLLIDFGLAVPELFRVMEVQPDALADRTRVLIRLWQPFSQPTPGPGTTSPVTGATPTQPGSGNGDGETTDELRALLPLLEKRASIPPLNALRLPRSVETTFAKKADIGVQIVGALQPKVANTLPTAMPNVKVTGDNTIRVYALRLKAGLFGGTAQREPQYEPPTLPGGGEFPQPNPRAGQLRPQSEWPEWVPAFDEAGNRLFLSGNFSQILPGSYIAIASPKSVMPMIFGGIDVKTMSRNAYGVSGETTMITLAGNSTWWKPDVKPPQDPGLDGFEVIRGSTVFAHSEELVLAEEPLATPICGGANDLIELDGLYSGLQSGRWLIVSGERADITDAQGQKVKGVGSSELVMLSEVIHTYDPNLPGDTIHTFIRLAKRLEYCFGRNEVKIYGNVVKATHGETREEILGSGDASKPLQSFMLRQPPLTYVPAPVPSGAASTLDVYVNNVTWHEAESLAGLGPNERVFVTKTDNEAKTTIVFGNGKAGARPPTGVENIKAVYRNGIGKAGNLKERQISLLVSRPLGVKEVINPLRASGGADAESRDQARRNAPLAVMALDRLVSVQDYADFTRTFAGIGKAVAQRLSDGSREIIHLTIAGEDDIPIDETSDLYRNLLLALRRYGDPDLPVRVSSRELLMLVLSVNVKLLTDYLWEPVARHIRAHLLDAFSFEQRKLGQDVLLSEVLSTIQAVEGVAYVDVDILGGIPEKKVDGGTRRLLTPTEITEIVQDMLPDPGEKQIPDAYIRVNLAGFEQGTLRPAQLAFLTPAVPDTLILNQI